MPAVAAVVTTGIYCRPGCGAQPRPGNVRPFPLAAAAEAAGYRACLRCRPYRMSPSVAWANPELVCRAVRLILDGALDDRTEAQLGARLGVSARHLRRLFMTHLGVTPDGLARSARAHFARRLLDDTDLTVTEIAFAAGFGSLRQFNRACQELFRAPPRELRAKRRKADRLVADGGLVLRLPFNGPLDWDAMAAYFAARAIPGVEHVSGGTYRRTIVIGTNPGVLELYRGGGDHLLLRAHLPHWEHLIHVVDRARHIASLDFELAEPVSHLAQDPIMGSMLRGRPGLRPPGTWDAYETGVRAIIARRAGKAAANATMGRLVERLGTPVPGLGSLGLSHTFPAPDTLATAEPGGLGLPDAIEGAVRVFAAAVAGDAVPLDRSVGLDQLITALTGPGGLDHPTAHHLALRMNEPDAWPTDDARPTDDNWPADEARSTGDTPRGVRERAGELAERWRPWRALAATYLCVDGRE